MKIRHPTQKKAPLKLSDGSYIDFYSGTVMHNETGPGWIHFDENDAEISRGFLLGDEEFLIRKP